MKKIIVLILCMILVLALAGCGSSQGAGDGIPMASKQEQEAFDAACELMEQGKYSEAADAFANVPLYDAIWSKLNEINRLTGSAGSNLLTGTTWYNLNCSEEALYDKRDYYLQFPGDGKVVIGMRSESGEIAYPCSFGEDSVYITISSTNTTYRLNVSQIDGITHIKGFIAGMLDCDFVPAEYYEELKQKEALPDVIEPISIELTPENWQEYFEIRPYQTSQTNNWGEVTNEHNGFAFYLKDEYLDRYTPNKDEAIAFYLKNTNAQTNQNNLHYYCRVYDQNINSNSTIWDNPLFGIIVTDDNNDYPAELSEQAISKLSVVNVTGHLLLSP